MILDELNEDNFILFAIKNHDNPESITTDDFFEDLKLFRKLRNVIRKFIRKNDKKHFNLCINTVLHLKNIFGDGTAPLIFYTVENEYYPYVKTFLKCLNFIPEATSEEFKKIPLDPLTLKLFEEIKNETN